MIYNILLVYSERIRFSNGWGLCLRGMNDSPSERVRLDLNWNGGRHIFIGHERYLDE